VAGKFTDILCLVILVEHFIVPNIYINYITIIKPSYKFFQHVCLQCLKLQYVYIITNKIPDNEQNQQFV